MGPANRGDPWQPRRLRSAGSVCVALYFAEGNRNMHNRICYLSMMLVAALVFTGCTGTRMAIVPPLSGDTRPMPQKYTAVGIREVPADLVYPPAGHPGRDFAREVELSGIAKTVYYPTRPDDRVDAVFEVKVDVTMDPHMGALLAKSFVTGLTLFLLEPAFWYDFDYTFDGTVDVVQQGRRTPVHAKATGSIGMKWLSLGQAQKMETDVIRRTRRTLFRQLLAEIGKQ